ncbi:MAG: hypothetical protein EOP04_00180 [Proteobacteria bacterium]|nr:MAG: hypothetical protein EOP04_00180 [Pseudomonadota bacterium]
MKFLILTFSLLALIACKSDLTLMGTAPDAQKVGNTEIFALSRLKVNAVVLVKVSGLNITTSMIVKVDGKT